MDNGRRLGRAVVVLRLHVDNPGSAPLRLSALAMDGLTPVHTVLPLNAEVAGHESGAVDVTVYPDCPLDRLATTLRAQLVVTGADWTAKVRIPVAMTRELALPGGICTVLENELAPGWRAPMEATGIEFAGRDLKITVDDLSRDRVAGIPVGNVLMPTVFVDGQLVSSSALVRAGRPTVVRLRGPPPCLQLSGTAPSPATVQLLVRENAGLVQRMIIVGPELTRWLRFGCTQ